MSAAHFSTTTLTDAEKAETEAFAAKYLADKDAERRQHRPHGSNADEWHLFLTEHLDNRAGNNGLTYMAVQIATAIDAARASRDQLLAAAKEDLAVFDSFEIDGVHCRELPNSAIARLRTAIAEAEKLS